MKTLFIITARGGSKGIPKKNIRYLCGKPLIGYSIDIAKQFAANDSICVSTDSEEIKKVVEEYGLKVPFLRPTELAQDGSGSFEVLQHAISYYEGKGMHYDAVVLLQPTSPLRETHHIQEAVDVFVKSGGDGVCSVKIAEATPSYKLYYEVNDRLVKCENVDVIQRQMASLVYQVNGSVYVFNPRIFKQYKSFGEVSMTKYLMTKEYSFDIDDEIDWKICELLLNDKNK